MRERKNCCKEKSMYWIPLKAVDQSSILPPTVPSRTIIPTINRYFYVVSTPINLTNGATLPATLFSNDDGNLITAFNIANPNGYVNLYINAMMQGGGIYTVTPSSLTLNPNNGNILVGTPIIIESVGFTSS